MDSVLNNLKLEKPNIIIDYVIKLRGIKNKTQGKWVLHWKLKYTGTGLVRQYFDGRGLGQTLFND